MITLPDLVREITAVAVVLGILGAALYTLRRYQMPRDGAPGPLRTISRLRLSEGLVLHLIECSGELCLVTEPKSGPVELRGLPLQATTLSPERRPLGKGARRRRSPERDLPERRPLHLAGFNFVETATRAADA